MNIDEQFFLGLCATYLSLTITIYGSWLVYKKQVKPHLYTVATWFLISSIVCGTLITLHEPIAAMRNGAMTLILAVTVMLCLRNNLAYIKPIDSFLFAFALLAIPIWLFVDQELSLLWLAGIEILGIIPTIRKAWALPYELNPVIYFGTSVAILCQLLSIGHPSSMVFNYFLLFSVLFFSIGGILILRRRYLPPYLKSIPNLFPAESSQQTN